MFFEETLGEELLQRKSARKASETFFSQQCTAKQERGHFFGWILRGSAFIHWAVLYTPSARTVAEGGGEGGGGHACVQLLGRFVCQTKG